MEPCSCLSRTNSLSHMTLATPVPHITVYILPSDPPATQRGVGCSPPSSQTVPSSRLEKGRAGPLSEVSCSFVGAVTALHRDSVLPNPERGGSGPPFRDVGGWRGAWLSSYPGFWSSQGLPTGSSCAAHPSGAPGAERQVPQPQKGVTGPHSLGPWEPRQETANTNTANTKTHKGGARRSLVSEKCGKG